MTDTQILIDAMKAQLANPTRAVVNSETAFVMDRLNKLGAKKLASEYWNWSCGSWESNPKFGPEVQELQTQLRAIDKGIIMPEWGYKGT